MKRIWFSSLLLLVCSIYTFGQNYEQYGGSIATENIPTTGKNSFCTQKNAFGIDLGYGAMNDAFNIATGIRYLHYFTPYFGMDFLKFNYAYNMDEEHYMQFMSGVRGNTPAFFKCMSVYGVARFGYGMIDFEPSGFCYELEIGLNLTRNIFIGYSFNHQMNPVYLYSPDVFCHTFRIGFNFGK